MKSPSTPMRPGFRAVLPAVFVLSLMVGSGCAPGPNGSLFAVPMELLPQSLRDVLADPVRFVDSFGPDEADAFLNDSVPKDQLTGDADGVTAFFDLNVACWGAGGRVAASASDPALEIYQTLQFDFENERLVRATFQRIPIFGGIEALFTQKGKYVVEPGGLLRFTVDSESFNGPGQPGNVVQDTTDRNEGAHEYLIRVSINDDGNLVTQFQPLPTDDPRTPAGFAEEARFVHRPLDCGE